MELGTIQATTCAERPGKIWQAMATSYQLLCPFFSKPFSSRGPVLLSLKQCRQDTRIRMQEAWSELPGASKRTCALRLYPSSVPSLPKSKPKQGILSDYTGGLAFPNRTQHVSIKGLKALVEGNWGGFKARCKALLCEGVAIESKNISLHRLASENSVANNCIPPKWHSMHSPHESHILLLRSRVLTESPRAACQAASLLQKSSAPDSRSRPIALRPGLCPPLSNLRLEAWAPCLGLPLGPLMVGFEAWADSR